MPFSTETLVRLREDATEIIGRYPKARSALLPLLYLVQAEDGYVSEDGIKFCAEVLEITETEVLGVATFYTMYKHEPAAEYQMGVCTNTTCAIMGGDQIYAELAAYIGGEDAAHGNGHHDIKSPDGKVAVERLECNAACDYAHVAPTRGPSRLCTWKQANRILAGYGDGQAAEGPSAGHASLVGLKLAKERGWKAPEPEAQA
jgi:NADH-quinone oxidoreductase subunit E